MTDVKLTFQFKHRMLPNEAMEFTNPIKILTTTKVEEVPEIIESAEAYQKQGYYVAGYVSYEAAEAMMPNVSFHQPKELPLIWFAVFEGYHQPTGNQATTYVSTEWNPDINREQFNQSIDEIHRCIKQGITYQVNYTFRLRTILEQIDREAWFYQLAEAQQANYAAFIQTESHGIISASPELFFAWEESLIETRPMKGTAKRGKTYEQDQRQIASLKNSEKERAENVMIVDLLRNDVARIAKTGSVKVPNLFTVETYPTVHQMTSTIQAKPKPNTKLWQVFQALFPCGSITGAPKMSTMKKIYELETSPREVYCGAIGVLMPEGKAVFNVPIRTVIYNRATQEATYGVGGGVTWDSSAEGEFEETASKAKVLNKRTIPFQLLETMRVNAQTIDYEKEHKSRLLASAYYFQIPVTEQDVDTIFHKIKAETKYERSVRLLVAQDGSWSYQEKEKSPSRKDILRFSLAEKPVDAEDIFLYHKTTERTVYKNRLIAGVDDTLLYNRSGKITEFTTGNLAYLKEGRWYTPPVQDGLLAGTYREFLLNEGKLEERSLPLDELNQVEEIAYFNSVRGWILIENLK
ncbi:aminodeoxychorismate synthase component I [Halalkalibacillus halophilus]|uniref:aminodeoxychorismate synthase component I n=1 Tax=Halalkalibacillus halophilus TaxID=392827 RepID=UPI00042123FA|nr:aminodeoxychorismate synthase component I [Halalkalibacillus halophilus]